MFWIRPTGNFLTHPRTSFRINELWSNKYDTQKSTIKKIRLERRTLRIFYIKQNNKLKWKFLNNQLAPLPRPSTNQQGNQIYMSVLDTSHRQISNTPKRHVPRIFVVISMSGRKFLRVHFVQRQIPSKFRILKIEILGES